MFLLQGDSSNLEDYITYCWASVKVVREGVYEVSRTDHCTVQRY